MAIEDIKVLDLGICDYAECWELQKELHAKRVKNESPDTLILVEHPAVFTTGKRYRGDNLLQSDHTIPIFAVERGGDITYHCPGQIVGYPIINLKVHGWSVHAFLRMLEIMLINVLGDFGIIAKQNNGLTGVWSSDKKVASIGIAVKKWITYHGFSLNINNDLSSYQLINPCGLDYQVMTNMELLSGQKMQVDLIKRHLIKQWRSMFKL